MSCKYGFYTCYFKGQADFCNTCDEGQNYQMEEKRRGGKRENAGRNKMFGEKAKRIMISIPASKEAEIRKAIEQLLEKYKYKPFKH